MLCVLSSKLTPPHERDLSSTMAGIRAKGVGSALCDSDFKSRSQLVWDLQQQQSLGTCCDWPNPLSKEQVKTPQVIECRAC